MRLAALRVGSWLGWFSVLAVSAALALGLPARHQALLLALVAAAALANAVVVCVPRRWWTTARRGERMLDLWSLGLVGFVCLLVLLAGGPANLDLLLFLIVPFLATVHTGMRRVAWLMVTFALLIVAMATTSQPLSPAQVALRVCLLAAATLLALAFADLTRREMSRRTALAQRHDLERVLLAESHHRVKNSLQTVSDLLLLGRPAGPDGRSFDETARRIRSIAIVHGALAEERGGAVDAARLLHLITSAIAPEASVTAGSVRLQPACAQHLGVVANELVTNAVQHGAPPIEVELRDGDRVELLVRDHGQHDEAWSSGLGLQLVERIVQQGLAGTVAIDCDAPGLTQVRVAFAEDATCVS